MNYFGSHAWRYMYIYMHIHTHTYTICQSSVPSLWLHTLINNILWSSQQKQIHSRLVICCQWNSIYHRLSVMSLVGLWVAVLLGVIDNMGRQRKGHIIHYHMQRVVTRCFLCCQKNWLWFQLSLDGFLKKCEDPAFDHTGYWGFHTGLKCKTRGWFMTTCVHHLTPLRFIVMLLRGDSKRLNRVQ